MITVQHPLGTFACWDDIVGRALQTGVFWDEQIRVVLDAGDPAGWAIDIGANIGFHTVHLARRYAHVVAVEAHPKTFELLQANLAANGVADKVTALNLAAFDRRVAMALAPGELVGWHIPDDLDLSQCYSASSVVFLPAEAVGKLPLVEGWPLDDVLPPGCDVQVIKTDAQGCDLRALMGLEQTIARCRPVVAFEIEQDIARHHGDSWADHASWLEARGYEVWRLHDQTCDFGAR